MFELGCKPPCPRHSSVSRRIEAALGRRHSHCSALVFPWLLIRPRHTSRFPLHLGCVRSTENAQRWLLLLGADVGWEMSLRCVLHSDICSAHVEFCHPYPAQPTLPVLAARGRRTRALSRSVPWQALRCARWLTGRWCRSRSVTLINS